MRAIAAILFAAALACGPAAAAPPRKTAFSLEPVMQLHVVRSAQPGCEPECLQWIAAQGRIVPGTLGQFREVLRGLGGRKLPIFIDSSGGAVDDALAIGRLIRAKGLHVAVTRTAFMPCAPGDTACRKAKTGGELRGVAQAHFSKCASSCAFILAGGTRRFVGQGIGVGVHRISMTLRMYRIWRRYAFGAPVETRKTLVSERRLGERHVRARSAYANIGRYFAEMGIGEEIMPLILSTPSDSIRWLTPDELRSTGLATHLISGEQLVSGASMPTSAMPGVPLPPMPKAEAAE